MRKLSKKMLSLVLSLAVLASCMVFSFSASAEAVKLWENHFDDPTASNWNSVYGNESANSNFNTSTGNDATYKAYAVPRKVGDNGYMAVGWQSARAQERPIGFIVMHEGATNKEAANVGTYGHAGKYRYSTLAAGSFQPDSGKYAIKLDYQVPSTVDLSDTDLEIYVAFSSKLWSGVAIWGTSGGGIQKLEADGDLVKEKIATITNANRQTGWQSTTTEIDLTVPSSKYWYTSIIVRATNISADPTLEGSEIYIDNIEIHKYESAADLPTVTFWQDGTQVGTTSGAAGAPFVMPTLTATVPTGAVLKYYSDAACRNEILLPTVYPTQAQDIYVKAELPTPPPHGLMWENDFDTQTASNWYSLYQSESASGNFNTGTTNDANHKAYAVPRISGANGYMAVGWQSAKAQERPIGFIVLHQDTTNKTAANIGTYGHAGKYRYSSLAGGSFQPDSGKYAVKLDYQVPSTVDLSDTDLEIYAAFSSKLWGGVAIWGTSAGGIQKLEAGGDLVKQKIATITADDRSGEWVSVATYIDLAVPSDKYWYTSIIVRATNISADPSLNGAEILLDNIQICKYDDMTDFPTVTFRENGTAVGSTSGIAGTQFVLPTLNVTVPTGAVVRYYSDAACTTSISLPTVYPTENTDIYVKVEQPVQPAEGLLWENDFNNGTTDNWLSKYGDKDDSSTFNTGTVNVDSQGFYNYAVYQNDGSNGYMAFGFENDKGHQRPAGFLVLHQYATNKLAANAGTYGHAGKYTDGSTLQGAFQPQSGKYAIKLDYQVPDTADLSGTDVELYVAFSSKTWSGTTTWGNYAGGIGKAEADGQMVKQLITTATNSDKGDGWKSVVAFMDVDVPADQRWWVSIIARASNTYADPAPAGSEVWIDNIEIYEYDDISDFPTISFYYDGAKIGESAPSMPGVGFTMPELSVYTPVGSLVSYYSDEACTNEITPPTVYPETSQNIYLKLKKTDNITWSFEDEAVGDVLSLDTRSGRLATVDDAMKNIGDHSLRINGYDKRMDFYPQLTLKDGNGQRVQVYKGRNYDVTFMVYKESTEPKYGINMWFAVTNDERPFDRNTYNVTDYEVLRNLDHTVAVGQWVEVTVSIENCASTGLLRMGIAGNYQGDHTFYIDDITVKETSLPVDNKADSFERYDVDTVVSLNTDGASITVSDTDRRSGNRSAKVVTLGNDVNAAPQMVVNNYRKEPITIEKGKSYRLSFWVLQPLHQPDYDLKYWVSVTDDDAAFTTTRKNVVVDTRTVNITDKNVWQNVRVLIENSPYSGKLRLGITGSTDVPHVFYIEDIEVIDYVAADPDAMNFEMYEVGTTLDLNQDANTITVTDEVSYTGDKAVKFFSDNNTYDDRPHMFVRDAEGNIVQVKKGDDFFVTFMVYIAPTSEYFNFSYWLAATPVEDGDKPFEYSADRSKYTSRNFLLPGEEFGTAQPPRGQWTQIRMAVMDCPYEGNLRIGLSHGTQQPYTSSFYLDDIKLYEPEYVTVKLDSNGSEDTYPDVTLMSDMYYPMDDYTDPYLEGYEFMGWYTTKTFEKGTLFDLVNTPIVGKTGDVITLYARWREWTGEVVVESNRPQEEVKYKTEYYEDKNWVETITKPEMPEVDEDFTLNEAEPVVKQPNKAPAKTPDTALPPWLLVAIIVGAVVIVGGGAVLAAILLKKKKS